MRFERLPSTVGRSHAPDQRGILVGYAAVLGILATGLALLLPAAAEPRSGDDDVAVVAFARTNDTLAPVVIGTAGRAPSIDNPTSATPTTTTAPARPSPSPRTVVLAEAAAAESAPSPEARAADPVAVAAIDDAGPARSRIRLASPPAREGTRPLPSPEASTAPEMAEPTLTPIPSPTGEELGAPPPVPTGEGESGPTLTPAPSTAERERGAKSEERVAPTETPAAPTRKTYRITTHTVAPGDTVAKLAERFGISARTIVRVNGLANPESLSPGQGLVILPISGTLYPVAAGDTVLALAERFGVIPEEIAVVNGLAEPYLIYPGQKLVIPEVSEAEQSAPTVPEPQAPSRPLAASAYEVAAGDTLGAIAARSGVSIESLLTANGLDVNQPLRVGQRLTIPPASTVLHVVRSGDTVTAVAALYGASTIDIIRANSLRDPYILEVGRRLVVPGGTPPARVAPPTPTPPPAPTATPTPGKVVARATAQPTPTRRPATVVPTASAAPPTRRPATMVPTATTAPPTPTPKPATPAPSRPGAAAQAVAVAMRYQGARYVFGGASPQTGFDCSGFVMYALRQAGVAVPRDLWGQLNTGAKVSRTALQPGDLVFFQNTYRPGLSHDGIYIGGGAFVHAGAENTGVIVSRLDHPYWNARYVGATRPY